SWYELPRGDASRLAVLEGDLTIHDHGGDTRGKGAGVGIGSARGDGRGIEQHDVRRQPRHQPAAIGKAEMCGGKAGHLADRLFEREEFEVAAVVAEHAREAAAGTR